MLFRCLKKSAKFPKLGKKKIKGIYAENVRSKKEGKAIKTFIFREGDTETILPVTPESFEVSSGINIETINIHEAGDAIIAGYGTLCTVKISCLFPAQDYSFLTASAKTDPYRYVQQFEDWSKNQTVLRFVVSDTPINLPVLVQEISYGEKDGTGDIYATVTLRQYREFTVQTYTDTQNNSRGTDTASSSRPDPYMIQPGDTLWAICRDYYGDATLYQKLADYNEIPNPNLIYAGKKLNLPDPSLL